MKIHAILIVKNEADILPKTLAHLEEFCSSIFVVDNGSSDGSLEILRKWDSKKVKVIGVIDAPFFDNLRRLVWRLVCRHASEGDWWLFADADEFYAEDVYAFLSSIPPSYGVVLKRQVYPIPTEDDFEEFSALETFNPAFFSKYIRSDWVEPRFVRHTSALSLDTKSLTLSGARATYPLPIKLIHYNWRTKAQVVNRISTRDALAASNETNFSHMIEREYEDLRTLHQKFDVYNIASRGLIWASSYSNFDKTSLRFVLQNSLLRLSTFFRLR
jgi:glycosyltransferase involved in cell wall biosynthesis